MVLVGLGSCFFLGQPDDLAYALAPWPFPSFSVIPRIVLIRTELIVIFPGLVIVLRVW
jgi:hypothetical protein